MSLVGGIKCIGSNRIYQKNGILANHITVCMRNSHTARYAMLNWFIVGQIHGLKKHVIFETIIKVYHNRMKVCSHVHILPATVCIFQAS